MVNIVSTFNFLDTILVAGATYLGQSELISELNSLS